MALGVLLTTVQRINANTVQTRWSHPCRPCHLLPGGNWLATAWLGGTMRGSHIDHSPCAAAGGWHCTGRAGRFRRRVRRPGGVHRRPHAPRQDAARLRRRANRCVKPMTTRDCVLLGEQRSRTTESTNSPKFASFNLLLSYCDHIRAQHRDQITAAAG